MVDFAEANNIKSKLIFPHKKIVQIKKDFAEANYQIILMNYSY